MDFAFSAQQLRFKQEIFDFAHKEITPEFRQKIRQKGEQEYYPEFHHKMAQKGWIGPQWPKQYGGQNMSRVDVLMLYEYMEREGAPMSSLHGSVAFAGESILALGSEDQKKYFLPKITSGEITFTWLLTEPNAGSDSAAIQLTAIDEGNDFVLNGQKIFNSGAHHSSHAMILTRTDQTVPKHKGISLFLVPLSSPGITVNPLNLIGGIRLNEVFFDNVRVPRSLMLGEKNQGFQNVMKYTLNFERANIARVGVLVRSFNELVTYLKSSGIPLGQAFHFQLAQIKAEIAAARLFAYRLAWMFDQGQFPGSDASMLKVMVQELKLSLLSLGIDTLGYQATIQGEDAPLRGILEHDYLTASAYLTGGGTPQIHRMVIAQRGLGLPRG